MSYTILNVETPDEEAVAYCAACNNGYGESILQFTTLAAAANTPALITSLVGSTAGECKSCSSITDCISCSVTAAGAVDQCLLC